MYALLIQNEHDYNIVEHVSNYSDDTVYVPEWRENGLPQSEYRKSHHLTNWVKENKPKWVIKEREFGIEEVINY